MYYADLFFTTHDIHFVLSMHSWWLLEVPYWWNWGCFVTFFLEIFPREVKDIIFTYARWDLREVRLKWTSENLELGKTQISFLGGGDLWWVWQGVGVWISSWWQYVRVGIRSWGQGVKVYIRSWGQGVGCGLEGYLCGEVCKVGYARWGMQGGVCEVGYMRWGIHEVGFTWGEIYMRWDLCEVRFMWGEIYMRWDMWDEIYVRWDMQGEIYTRWDKWGEICARWDLRESPGEIFHSLILLNCILITHE